MSFFTVTSSEHRVIRPRPRGVHDHPQRVGVGYVDSAIDYQWPVSHVTLTPASLVFIATDGLTDQIGGPRNIAFGKSKAFDTILEHRDQPATAIGEALQRTLANWQGEQTRRDDLTLFCARLGNPS